jgi:TPR repeat protein
MLQHGVGGDLDPEEAFRFLRLAAEAGDPKAWLELGHAYYVGLGTRPDFKEARKWLLLAAAHGDPGAQSMLGQMLAANAADAADVATAHQMLRQASDQGGSDALYALGSFLLHGTQFSNPDPTGAGAIAERLLILKSPLGARLNAEVLESGQGSNVQSIEGAARWYLEGARQGDPFSQAAIARRYEQGQGVERNLIEAYAWYNWRNPSAPAAPARAWPGCAVGFAPRTCKKAKHWPRNAGRVGALIATCNSIGDRSAIASPQTRKRKGPPLGRP